MSSGIPMFQNSKESYFLLFKEYEKILFNVNCVTVFLSIQGNCNAGSHNDKRNFGLLVKELNIAFKPKGFILSAAVAAGKSKIDAAYDVPILSKYLDFINVMAYDLHGHWEATTGEHAALFPSSQDPHKHLTVVGLYTLL